MPSIVFTYASSTRGYRKINGAKKTTYVNWSSRLILVGLGNLRFLQVNACHFWLSRMLVLVNLCFFSSLPSKVELFKQCVTTRGETTGKVVEVMR
jgi:hypothetical protein